MLNQHFSSQVDVISIGCNNNLQRKNRLKGLALEKLVRKTMSYQQSDLTVKNLLKKLASEDPLYFIITQPFRTQFTLYDQRWEYLHFNDLPPYLEFWVRKEQLDHTWKVCDHCGNRIKAGEQFSRKCWHCNEGWFHFSDDVVSTWILRARGARKRVVKTMINNGYLKPAPLRKRLDFFRYNKGTFEIYEVKNKENTGLSSKDLRTSLIYPFILTHAGFAVDRFVLIYNGFLTEELQREIRKGYASNFSFAIELWPIKRYLEQKKVHIKRIKITKNDDCYTYHFIKGSSEKIIIDLTDIAP